MDFAYETLEILRQRNPAWRLLRSDHASLVAGFLYRAFIEHNNRVLPESTLAERLEDELFGLRQLLGEGKFPKKAAEYLDDWTGPDRAWLRKFYQEGSDEPHFDLTPAAEKAIAWLGTLAERAFVGTESRLRTVFDLLRQIRSGAEADPAERIEELKRRRREIDAEIDRAERGEIQPMDDTAIQDRFQQVMQVSRELLADFREVEQNFRTLERQFRENVAKGPGTKGDVLDASFSRRHEIAESDQGRSFGAFWDFLMSDSRTDQFERLLQQVLGLPAIRKMEPDDRAGKMHHEWTEAGEQTQRTVRQLSGQLRRFVDDRAQLENRRIMELLQRIEKCALALRDSPPKDRRRLAEIEGTAARMMLPMEHPLHTPAKTPSIRAVKLEAGDENVDVSVLYHQVVIDRDALAENVRRLLQSRSQVTLREVCELRPLQHGLAELVAYLELVEPLDAAVSEARQETVTWRAQGPDGEPVLRAARIPEVIFVA